MLSDGNPPEYDWEIYLKETARKIVQQQSPSQVSIDFSQIILSLNYFFNIISLNTYIFNKINHILIKLYF